MALVLWPRQLRCGKCLHADSKHLRLDGLGPTLPLCVWHAPGSFVPWHGQVGRWTQTPRLVPLRPPLLPASSLKQKPTRSEDTALPGGGS